MGLSRSREANCWSIALFNKVLAHVEYRDNISRGYVRDALQRVTELANFALLLCSTRFIEVGGISPATKQDPPLQSILSGRLLHLRQLGSVRQSH